MKTHTFHFHFEAEANAFVSGVEYVSIGSNDFSVCGPVKRTDAEEGEENAWAVVIHDYRPVAPDDTCPLCGTRDSEAGT